MFSDRSKAGKKLAARLQGYRGASAVVIALPRGGVVVASEVARALSLPLDIITVRKIGHPLSPEYAIGAVDDSGATLLNESEMRDVDTAWIAGEVAAQEKEARRRASLYRAGKGPLDIKGKTALIVDDGIATGLTMRLAIRIAKRRGALKVVVAVPVAPRESLAALRSEGAGDVVMLEPPEEFAGAVGSHYEHFDQVEDKEVVYLMRQARE